MHPHIRGAIEPVFFKRLCSMVHPHVCGVNSQTYLVDNKITRFIPTYVGLMNSFCKPCGTPAVHPHIRGVNAELHRALWHHHRFIPTYVGLIVQLSPHCSEQSVHPHIRGVNVRPEDLLHTPFRFIPTYVGLMRPPCCTSGPRLGSSPHTWG